MKAWNDNLIAELQCWTVRHRNSFGQENLSKGCLNSREKIPFVCGSKSHSKQSKHAHNDSNPDYEHFAAYSTKCCDDKDFCNDGFPELPTTRDCK